jgi:hypothetical protein
LWVSAGSNVGDISVPARLISGGGLGQTDQHDMSEVIRWQGGRVEVQARLVPRFLWSTASIDVSLEGRCILRSGGQMKATGSHAATFNHSGSAHTAEVSWGYGFLRSFPYKLRIDGISICAGRVDVRNWPLGLIIPFLAAAALLAAFRLGHVSRI